jgi:hypothetical protein
LTVRFMPAAMSATDGLSASGGCRSTCTPKLDRVAASADRFPPPAPAPRLAPARDRAPPLRRLRRGREGGSGRARGCRRRGAIGARRRRALCAHAEAQHAVVCSPWGALQQDPGPARAQWAGRALLLLSSRAPAAPRVLGLSLSRRGPRGADEPGAAAPCRRADRGSVRAARAMQRAAAAATAAAAAAAAAALRR